MALSVPQVAYGRAVPISIDIWTDNHGPLLTDNGYIILKNEDLENRYTNPDLHRRINLEAKIPQGSNYVLVLYDEHRNPYPQTVDIGVWDRLHSTRITQTFIHDEESETSEIP